MTAHAYMHRSCRKSGAVRALASALCAFSLFGNAATPPVWDYEVVASYPHDPLAFTQGLLYADGVLYESTGRYGRSELRRVDLTTGRVLNAYELPRTLFGEGLARVGDRLFQLTWRARRCRVYNIDTFSHLGDFNYPGEGWGLAYDGSQLFMSNGSHVISIRNPSSFVEVRRIRVEDERGPVRRLNELEAIDGRIWANVWGTPRIAVIDPANGGVLAWLDLSELVARQGARVDVLNGIAQDPTTGRIFITGKNWPRLYEIALRGVTVQPLGPFHPSP